MPGQDGLDANPEAVSSGQPRPADPTWPPSHPHDSRHPRQLDLPEPPNQKASGSNNDDTSDSLTKSSKAKSSDSLRRSQACLACRKRKLRCDARKPTCTRCEKAWLAYHPLADVGESSTERPPPCEYDTSLLAKIFKKSSSEDGNQASSLRPSTSHRREASQSTHDEQLFEQNQQLRAQLSHLQQQLRRDEGVAMSSAGHTSSVVRFGSQQRSPTTAASKLSIHNLAGSSRDAAPSTKRPRSPYDADMGRDRKRSSFDASALHSQPSVVSRDKTTSSASRHYETSSTETPDASRSSAVGPSIVSWRAAVPRHVSTSAATHYLNEPASRTHSTPLSSPPQSPLPPLPGRQALDRLLEACKRESWLFATVNSYALSDVAALLETSAENENDVLTAQSLMLVCIATGIPLLASTLSTGIQSSPTLASINDLLKAQAHWNLNGLDSPLWVTTVAKIYGDGARELLNQAQSRWGVLSPATFVVRLLLVELSHTQSAFSAAQSDLAVAASEARLLRLHSVNTDAHPRLSTGPPRSSHLARALRGLVQSKEETLAFWSLVLHDCVHSRLALLPVLVERQTIQTVFPHRTDSGVTSPPQRNLDQVEAHLKRRRGLPALEPADDSMSLLIKVGLVLDQCSEDNASARRHHRVSAGEGKQSPREDLDQAFVAAHESIRNSRMMLSQFDDRTLSRSDVTSTGTRLRENLVSTLSFQDRLRFAAEVIHHLSVLALFETEIDVTTPLTPSGEARGMIANAAVWLSRLAGIALQDATMLCGLPSFCSPALFLASRWLIFLQAADPDHYHTDLSTIVLCLRKRGEWFGRDQMYARAVVAIKREAEFYGRVCISPFTWPMEAVSEFVPLTAARGGRGQTKPAERGFVSIATLAASVDDAEVGEMADTAKLT